MLNHKTELQVRKINVSLKKSGDIVGRVVCDINLSTALFFTRISDAKLPILMDVSTPFGMKGLGIELKNLSSSDSEENPRKVTFDVAETSVARLAIFLENLRSNALWNVEFSIDEGAVLSPDDPDSEIQLSEV
jgi:hypothetical protein